MTDYVPSEKGVPIRQPSTANLMVDSADRGRLDLSGTFFKVSQAPDVFDFTISRNYSILNGFFTRIGLTELVLEWDTPTIQSKAGNNLLIVDISGAAAPVSQVFPNQFIQTAANVFDGFVTAMNDISGTTGYFFEINNKRTPLALSTYQLICKDISGGSPAEFRFQNTSLAWAMNLYGNNPGDLPTNLYGPFQLYFEPTDPDLRLLRYIDFVSPSLTYNQDLKDASTNINYTDVLARWYFAIDQELQLDKYNFPIYQGYSPFVMRRLFNPPKQIKWSPNQPIGQLTFQVYGELIAKDIARNLPYGVLTVSSFGTQYLMTLQVSEV